MTTDTLSGKIVTILGGSGFVGRHLAQELLARGARLRIASRHPKKAFAIKPLGNLGQVQFAGVDVTKAETLAPVLAGSDAVINLIGAFAGNLDALQGKGAGEIAAAAKAAGATAFVHVSAIGADAGSAVAYARTKAEGETAVLAAFPSATIVRPSLMFGSDDNFVNMFGELISRLPALPVFAPQARLQPVFVDDVAVAIANALGNVAAQGKTFELAGPEVITMLDLNQRIAKAQGRSRTFVELPDAVSGLIAATTGWLPGAPISSDQLKLLQAGSVASDSAAGLAELGVTPRPLGLFLDRWMVRFRKHGRFGTKTASA
ncbi:MULTISPECIES: complex I NDUFA9 subunit family protein [Novosphingobium]|jgi:NADH dehydrogenase|uniref:complex I NDUFA9 subunit family protein n=1 Tax=Novosphingobium TaxID=165696 RepID=UPI0022F24C5F|nr:complex I NDUFA9 subunit family protein [Novosphingobium resinovorum]GLK46167.1 3-beta-hydroxy-Delta(5)-steroid dehydrogenase [Novosphingobium resinovorum]